MRERELVSTNIRLYRERLQELKVRALHRGESLSELIRQAIDLFLGYEKKPGRNSQNDPFFEIIGLGKDSVTDGSVHHDWYLYGMRRKKKK